MSQPKFCAKCGNALSENEKFCGKCGNPVGAAPAPVPVPAAVPEAAEAVTETAQNVQAQAEAAAQDVQAQATAAVQDVQTQAQAAAPAAAATPAAEMGKNIGAAIAKHKVPIIIGVLALAAVIAAIIIILNLTKYQKIDAKDLFKVSFKGLNGSGTATAFLNMEAADPDAYRTEYDEDGNEIKKDYSKYFATDKKTLLKAYDKAADKDEAEDMRDALLHRTKGEYDLKIELDKKDGLSNGDKITCTVDFDEDDLLEAKIKLENTEFEVEVEGLVEGVELDLFDGFAPKFSGQDESGEVEYDSTSSKFDFIEYYISDGSTWSLKNGDVLEFTANLRTSRLDDYTYLDEDSWNSCYFTYNGTTYIVKDMSPKKTFTVSGLTEPQKIDVFADIKFNTTGASPFLRINSVDESDCDSVVADNVSFYIDTGDLDYLKEGDTFKVKAYAYSGLKEAGFKPDGTPDEEGYYVKEFTVDDSYGHYLTSVVSQEDLDAVTKMLADQFEKLKDYEGGNYISGVNVGGTIKTVGDIAFDSGYFVAFEGFEEGTLDKYDTKSYLYYTVKLPLTVEVKAGEDETKTENKTYYASYKLNSPYIDANGDANLESSFINIYLADNVKDIYDKQISKEEGKISKIGPAPADDESKPDESEPADESQPADESEPADESQPADESSAADDSSEAA